MGKHSKFSPSSAHRWMNCPGSLKLIEQYEAPPAPEEGEEEAEAEAKEGEPEEKEGGEKKEAEKPKDRKSGSSEKK